MPLICVSFMVGPSQILKIACVIVTSWVLCLTLYISLSLSLSFTSTHSLSCNNALDPLRPLSFPEHLCNKPRISELQRYLTQTAARGHSVGSFPAGLYLHSSFLSPIPSISESHQSHTKCHNVCHHAPCNLHRKPPSKSQL